MTSKIKVDNIENQCGGAVVTKCGATTTISGSVVKADDIQAADGGNLINQCGTTITLGASGDTINLAAGASQTGFGRTGTVDWQTGSIKTATFTAVNGEGYFCNTSGGAFTVNLPAGSAGAIVSFADYAATFQTNSLRISPNGTDKMGGLNADVSLFIEGQSATFVYVDETQGWINTMDSTSNVRGDTFITATGGTITTDGDCKVHSFTGPGTFCVSALGSASGPGDTVKYLIVAGGGGMGYGYGSAGGAGGYRASSFGPAPLQAIDTPVTVTGYPIVIGAGGAGAPVSPNYSPAYSGNPSSAFGLTATAGGGGRSGNSASNGTPGGSGSGATGGAPNGSATAGSGNTPPVSPPQGNPGEPAAGNGEGTQGGGAGAAGSFPRTNVTGVSNAITGTSLKYACGGRSGGISPRSNSGFGGTSQGVAGCSGIVVIRYKFQ